jgi:hypothetical protein
MDWKDIAGTVGKAAPLLGTLLGGPAGAAVGALVASALGTDSDPASVSAALRDPATVVRLREIEATRATRLEELLVDHAKAELAAGAADRADARKLQTAAPSRMPAVLTSFVVGAFTGTLVLLLKYDVPATNRDILVYMIGQLSGGFASALAFWLGTTKDSARKTELLAQSAPVRAE